MKQGSTARQAGNLELAENYWQQALDLSMQASMDETWQDTNLKCLATIFVEQGKCGELESALRSIIEKRQNSPDKTATSLVTPWDYLGQNLTCSGKYDEAESNYQKALAAAALTDDYRMSAILVHLAELHLKMNKITDAESELRKALAFPSSLASEKVRPQALRDLAQAFMVQNQALQAAAAAKLAKDLQAPKTGFEALQYTKTLGDAYFASNLYPKAVVEYKSALREATKLGKKDEINDLSKKLAEAERLAKIRGSTQEGFGSGAYEWRVPSDLIN